jgi:hypothetical protein
MNANQEFDIEEQNVVYAKQNYSFFVLSKAFNCLLPRDQILGFPAYTKL